MLAVLEGSSQKEFPALLHALSLHGASLKPDDPASAENFLEIARDHDLQPLLYYHGRKTGALETWPPEAVFSLKREARREQLLEAQRLEELLRVFAGFKEEGIPFLILKGTALAYGLYPEPSLRPRCDTDLLIPEQYRPRLAGLMDKLGYVAEPLISGELVNYQQIFYRADAFGFETVLDLHWKLANPQAVAGLLAFNELAAEAAEIPQLGGARALSARHALLHACIHRAAHHHGEDLLIWLYDMRLLGFRMEGAWEAFLDYAADKKALRLAAESLAACAHFLKTGYPAGVMERITAALLLEYEPSAVFAERRLTRAGLLLSDLKNLPFGKRALLLREMLFPSAEFMRQRHPGAPAWQLPFLYAARIFSGAVKMAAGVFGRRDGK